MREEVHPCHVFLHGNPPWRISRYQEMKIMTPKGFLTLGLQQLSKHAENKWKMFLINEISQRKKMAAIKNHMDC